MLCCHINKGQYIILNFALFLFKTFCNHKISLKLVLFVQNMSCKYVVITKLIFLCHPYVALATNHAIKAVSQFCQ